MKVCFIGLGSIGTRHCQNLAELCRQAGRDLLIHAVRSSERPLPQVLTELDVRVFHSFGEMDGDYDIIFITNPTALHYDTMMQVGARARCFFIEKPVFELSEMDVGALPFRTDAVAYVAAPLRYTAVLRAARAFVAEERVYSVRAISSSYLPDWRPGTDYRNTYSAHRELGGGVEIDLIHEWDYLTMLFGFPEKVHSVMGRFSALELDSNDLAIYIASYPDKAVELHLDYFGRETVRRLELMTERGTAVFDIAHGCVAYPDGETATFDEDPNDKYLNEMRYFLALCDGKITDNLNSIAHAVGVLRLTRGEYA